MSRSALALLVLLVPWAGWGCGSKGCPAAPPGDEGQGFVWAPRWSADDLPGAEMKAVLKGAGFDRVHVQFRQEGESTRIEILDRSPDEPCGRSADGQGFSVKLPLSIREGDRLEKALHEHPRGWSGYMVTRGKDGSTVSALAQGWSFALVVSELDAAKGKVWGRLAVGFDDGHMSGAAGGFVGEFCQ